MQGSYEHLYDDVFYSLDLAQKAYNLLPPLPPNIKPVHLRILHAMYRIRVDASGTRISDINTALDFLLPNTTKFINELVQLGAVEKLPSKTDKRVVLVRVTSLGQQYIDRYIIKYHAQLQAAFSAIGESNCMVMIETISKIYQSIQKIYQQPL